MNRKISLVMAMVLLLHLVLNLGISGRALAAGEAPTVVEQTPVSNSITGTVIDFTMTFDQPIMKQSTGRVYVKRASDDFVVFDERVNSAKLYLSSDKMRVIWGVEGLEYGQKYYVLITDNAFKNNKGNFYEGIIDKEAWTFTVEGASPQTITSPSVDEATPLQLVAVTPADKAWNIPVDYQIAVYFNEKINIGDKQGIRLRVKGSSAEVESVIETVGQSLRITPVQPLNPGSTYLITIQSGAVIDSLTGAKYTETIETVFETQSNSSPEIQQTLTKPELQSVDVQNNVIRLRYNVLLGERDNLPVSGFKVMLKKSRLQVSRVYTSGNDLYLVLRVKPSSDDELSISYNPKGSGAIVGTGYSLVGFDNYKAVVVSGGSNSPTLRPQSISAAGGEVIITYPNRLRAAVLKPEQFTIYANGTKRTVTKAKISGNQIILTLSVPVAASTHLKLSFNKGADPIVDVNGNEITIFVEYEVTAESAAVASSSPKQPSFVTANSGALSGNGGYVLNINTAKAVKVNSSSGNAITRYMIHRGQLEEALRFVIQIHENQGTNKSIKPLIFNVPDTEGSAELVVPVSAVYRAWQEAGDGGKRSVFAVQYKGAMYEIPLKELPFAEIARSLGNGALSVDTLDTLYLIIQIEFVSPDQLSVSPVINGSQAKLMQEAIQIRVIVISGTANSGETDEYGKLDGVDVNRSNSIINLSHIGKIYLRIIINLGSADQTALVRYDTVNKRLILLSSGAAKADGQLILIGYADPNKSEGSGGSANAGGTTGAAGGGQGLIIGGVSLIPGNNASTNSGSSNRASGGVSSASGGEASSTDYTDTSKHWAKAEIDALTSKGIIGARSSNTNAFEPDRNITRAEFAEYISKALNLAPNLEEAKIYPDVNQDDQGGYIGAANEAGIITGYPDGFFRPDQFITREEMALMMVRALKYGEVNTSLTGTPEQALTKFRDASKIRYKEAVAQTVQSGVIQGINVNTFQPKGNATRAQAVVMIKRVLDRIGELR
ncbi:S-layer homology domain-containing protein [Paenibacillus massiliensis]|uniref:S-layer homology domain-containing protein n=1 Tax=Paenibacillus massiliensis TaxID=225917 RepID=UPI0004AFEBB2|nr:S-layer homology domain-containing protein [Paenibacillus massiliensis]